MVTVGTILLETGRFLRREWRSILVWCAILAIVRFLLQQFLPPATMDAPLMEDFWSRTVPRWIVMLMQMPILYAACLRAAANPDPNERAFHLRTGGDELRLAGLGLFLGTAILVVWIIAILLVALPGGFLGALFGGFGVFVVLLLFTAALGALIFAIVCLSPIWPLTIVRHRFAVDEGWALGRAHFWPLLGSYAVIWAAIVAIALLTLTLFAPDLLWALAHLRDPEAHALIQAETDRHLNAGVLPRIAFAAESGVVSGWILALHIGSIGCATRLILAERGAKSEGASPGPWSDADGSEG